jgi:hypothetical protein
VIINAGVETEMSENKRKMGFDLDTGRQTWVIVEGHIDFRDDGMMYIENAVIGPGEKSVVPPKTETEVGPKMRPQWVDDLSDAIVSGIREMARVFGRPPPRAQPAAEQWTEKELKDVRGESEDPPDGE